ncbi:glycosyltransferase [Alistipes provencensis]|uniref:glycosyltransferase n=1 Tax=Alistipes provencensis TaxID=1816676 RepID=UPI0007ECBE5A|nr:glycosyltransferase [Alistipes provencensis]
MQFIDNFLACYGWEGAALAGSMLLMLGVQFYYYIFVYGRIPGYKNNRRAAEMETEPPVSVVVPLFSEDYSFVEERLPLILAQNYPDFEVVIVYVGHDSDFYEDLARLKQSFPQITTTKIQLDPRFPISRKMALNVGIKSAHYECMVFTSTDAVPQTDRWLSLMAKGFMRGEIVVGYCGVERRKGLANYLMRTGRMMQSAAWIARAVQRRAYRGTLHNYGFTKRIYFGANGFSHLNMNIGEDDLFMQRVMTRDNVSVILSPRATLREKTWGGMGWWMSQLRYYGSAFRFYPQAVRTYVGWELWSRVLFFATVICALAVMPLEYKIAALALVAVRYVAVALEVRRVARRLGESGIMGRYFIYDLLSPLWAAVLWVMLLRRDDRVWR